MVGSQRKIFRQVIKERIFRRRSNHAEIFSKGILDALAHASKNEPIAKPPELLDFLSFFYVAVVNLPQLVSFSQKCGLLKSAAN